MCVTSKTSRAFQKNCDRTKSTAHVIPSPHPSTIPAYPIEGPRGGWEPIPAVIGLTEMDSGAPSHTYGQFRVSNSPKFNVYGGGGRTPEYSEKTQANTGRTCKPQGPRCKSVRAGFEPRTFLHRPCEPPSHCAALPRTI